MSVAIKPGYKKTEVGVIPEDWEVSTLHCITRVDGLVRGPFGGSLKKEDFVDTGYKVYEQKNAIHGDANVGRYYITEEKFKSLRRFEVFPGDFIVSCSGTIGKLYEIPNHSPKGIINQALLKITINYELISPRYFYYIFSSKDFQERVIDDTQGGAMKNLVGMHQFRESKLPLPPLPEQGAIASALADMDALLDSLEELLTKKRQLKQAAMQELLTGKTRLEGFEGGWEEKRLGDLAEIRKGQVITERNARLGEIPVIAGGRTPAYFNALSNRPANCITVSASGAGAGYVALHPYKIWASDCSTIEPSKDYEVIFLYWVLKMKQGQIYGLQSGGAQPHVQPHDLQPLMFSLPPLSEQKAIATILSEMDAELEVLVERVIKTRQLKQGMMQELLTGRTRLI